MTSSDASIRLFPAALRLMRDMTAAPLAFAIGWAAHGLYAGMCAATACVLAIVWWEHHHGRTGTLTVFALVAVISNVVVGAVTRSAFGYLMQPCVLGFANGLAWIGSCIVRRPLAGMFVKEFIPHAQARRRDLLRVSAAWGALFTLGAIAQFVSLTYIGVSGFAVAQIVEGVAIVGLFVVSIGYVARGSAVASPAAP